MAATRKHVKRLLGKVVAWHGSSVPSAARSTAAKFSKRRRATPAPRSRHFRKANEQVMHSLRYAYRDRRARKGEFRRFWIVRINAACREHDMSYSRFMAGLEGGRGRRRPQDPRRPRGARAGGVRRARRDGTCRARRCLTPSSGLATKAEVKRLRELLRDRQARATNTARSWSKGRASIAAALEHGVPIDECFVGADASRRGCGCGRRVCRRRHAA